MMCDTCGSDYDSLLFQNCPYCNSDTSIGSVGVTGSTVKPTITQLTEIQLPPIPVDASRYVAKPKIMCPKCHQHNNRLNTHCTSCFEPLPTYDAVRERENRVKQIVLAMDPDTKERYSHIGVHLVIAEQLGLEKKMYCHTQHKNNCKQILTPLDKNCPNCGTPHMRYDCALCGTPLEPDILQCQNCGASTYFSDHLATVHGEALDKGAEEILQLYEQKTRINAHKRTFSSRLQFMDIMGMFTNIRQIARQFARNNELLSKYLADFSDNSKSIQLGSAMENIISSGFTPLNLSGIKTPQMSDSLKSLVENPTGTSTAPAQSVSSSVSPPSGGSFGGSTFKPSPSPSTPSTDDDDDENDDDEDPTKTVWDAVDI